MLRQISEDVRVNIKDRLRDARNVIRQGRHDSTEEGQAWREVARHLPPFPVKGVEGILGHAASAVDDALSAVESVVRPVREAGAGSATTGGLRAYFPPDQAHRRPSEAGRRFRRDMYYLARDVLGGLRIDAVRIHEASFAAVHDSMIERHGATLARLEGKPGRSTDIEPVAAACAVLLIELLRHQPIRFAETARRTSQLEVPGNLDMRCMAPMALLCGLATLATDERPYPELAEIAILATDARHDRFVTALHASDAARDLSTLYASLLAHLP